MKVEVSERSRAFYPMVRSLGFILSAKRVNGNFSTGE
jgi:hypothetical protein